jgi:hypothetical protein
MRSVWPAMQPFAEKVAGTKHRDHSFLPEPLTTDNFTPPFCTFITVSGELPWE